MRLRIRDIDQSTKELDYEESAQDLNRGYARGNVRDFRFDEPARVHLSYYGLGEDVVVGADIESVVQGVCARCLEEFSLRVEGHVDAVWSPRSRVDAEEAAAGSIELYEGEEVDVSPRIHEEIFLRLPVPPLCREECRGLCPTCGANLNQGACRCSPAASNSPFAALRGIPLGRRPE